MKIAAITVGHSPRNDLTPELSALLGPGFEIVEKGALDAYSPDDARREFAPKLGEQTAVSRLGDGTMLEMSYEKAMPLVQKVIHEAAGEGAQAVVMLCTGTFPDFTCPVPLLTPYGLVHSLVPRIAAGVKTGILFPFESHAEGMRQSWAAEGLDMVSAVCAPTSTPDQAQELAQRLREERIGLLVLDCIGYTVEMRDSLAGQLQVPVVHAKTLLASTLHCLFPNTSR